MASRQTFMIPRAPVARILMRAGAKRVSADAIEAFAQVIEDIAVEIAQNATVIAKHTGRKTVQDSDIRLAAKQ